MTSPLFSKSPKARVFGTLIFIALAMGWLRAQAQTTSGAVVSGSVTIGNGRVAAFRVKAKVTMRRIAYTVWAAPLISRLRDTAAQPLRFES